MRTALPIPIWHITLAKDSPTAGSCTEPLFIPGESLAEVQAAFDKWDDMGYRIESVKRVGRVIMWGTWK